MALNRQKYFYILTIMLKKKKKDHKNGAPESHFWMGDPSVSWVPCDQTPTDYTFITFSMNSWWMLLETQPLKVMLMIFHIEIKIMIRFSTKGLVKFQEPSSQTSRKFLLSPDFWDLFSNDAWYIGLIGTLTIVFCPSLFCSIIKCGNNVSMG